MFTLKEDEKEKSVEMVGHVCVEALIDPWNAL